MKKLIIALLFGWALPAAAADLPARTVTPKAAVTVANPLSGFSISANIGAALTNQQVDFVSLPGTATGNVWPAGFLGGATIGYGGALGSLYGGLEAEVNHSFNKGEAPCGVLGTCSVKDSVLLTQGFVIGAPMSTITGAIPPLPGNTRILSPNQWPIPVSAPAGFSSANIMPLLKFGLAERNISACENPAAGLGQVCGQTWLFGPYVGAELRFIAAQNWSVGLDYKYAFFNKSFTPANSAAVFGPFTQEFNKLNEQLVTLKVGYHF
jgi:opacity protein-like surface antigen